MNHQLYTGLQICFGTPQSLTEDVADLEDKTATELKKLPSLQSLLEKKALQKLLVLNYYNSTFEG